MCTFFSFFVYVCVGTFICVFSCVCVGVMRISMHMLLFSCVYALVCMSICLSFSILGVRTEICTGTLSGTLLCGAWVSEILISRKASRTFIHSALITSSLPHYRFNRKMEI